MPKNIFTEETSAAVKDLSNKLGVSEGEVIRRALNSYIFFNEAKDTGKKVFIKDGAEQQEVRIK